MLYSNGTASDYLKFGGMLAFVGCVIMYLSRGYIGTLFGSSDTVNTEIAKIMPIFLVSVPFVAITRISTAGFYATEKADFCRTGAITDKIK